jgi:hypothetical protein
MKLTHLTIYLEKSNFRAKLKKAMSQCTTAITCTKFKSEALEIGAFGCERRFPDFSNNPGGLKFS